MMARPSLFLAAFPLAALVACSTANKDANPPATAAEMAQEAEFTATIEAFSERDREYNGLYNQFDFRATLQNSKVQTALLKKQAGYFKWDAAKVQDEMAKASADMNKQTLVFCAFFTPIRWNDNLADSKSIWRVLLETGGKRYVGTVKQSRKLLAELNALFSYHTRWTTPYVFTFPVPIVSIERERTTLTITGPLGTRSIAFKSLGNENASKP